MHLAPADFAMSYITCSGRIDIVCLRKRSPRFVERYERESPISARRSITTSLIAKRTNGGNSACCSAS